MTNQKVLNCVGEHKALEDDLHILSTVSTDSVDRMGDVVEQQGWMLESYKSNPVVLWNHDYSRPPVGKCVDITIKDGRMTAVTKFADTAFGREVYNLYKGRFMSAFSVGFRPLEWEPMKGGRGMRYTKNELLEYSCVPVPANQDATLALRQAVQRGLFVETLPFLSSDVSRALADVDGEGPEELLAKLTFYRENPKLARVGLKGIR
jgi:HK97 family phage prohead protease